jgi:hypothetical protein
VDSTYGSNRFSEAVHRETARYAMLLWWMGGNSDFAYGWGGDGADRISTGARLGTEFAVNPQVETGCGGTVHPAATFLITFDCPLRR